MEKVIGWIKAGTSAGLSLICLAIVLQIIFSGTVPFVGGDVIATITGIINSLGEAGLVGLLSAAVVYKLFTSE